MVRRCTKLCALQKPETIGFDDPKLVVTSSHPVGARIEPLSGCGMYGQGGDTGMLSMSAACLKAKQKTLPARCYSAADDS